MRPSDSRPTHDGTSRSPRLDSLAWYAQELEGAEMDGALKGHLMVRLRRVMKACRGPLARDLATAAERFYRETVDPAVPAAERRRALGSWLRAMSELETVERRGRPKTQAGRSGLLFSAARRTAARVPDEGEPGGDDGVIEDNGREAAPTDGPEAA